MIQNMKVSLSPPVRRSEQVKSEVVGFL